MVTILDTGTCNLASLCAALRRLKANFEVAELGSDVGSSDGLIVPGVASFAQTIEEMHRRGFIRVVNERNKAGTPIFGICSGLQVLADLGEENGMNSGLGVIKGICRRIPSDTGLKVPNQGWCKVSPVDRSSVLLGQVEDPTFYFSHSYFVDCEEEENVSGWLQTPGISLPVVVEKQNLFGTQFHPEKSQSSGLQVLNSFLKVANCE